MSDAYIMGQIAALEEIKSTLTPSDILTGVSINARLRELAAELHANQSCGGVDGHAPNCRADIDPAVNRQEARLQQGLRAGVESSPHDPISDLVEIGVEAMHEARARHFGEHKPNRYEERGELYRAYMGAVLTAIEKAGHRIVPVEPTAEMTHAGRLTIDMDGWDGPAICWEWMLDAAPKVTP